MKTVFFTFSISPTTKEYKDDIKDDDNLKNQESLKTKDTLKNEDNFKNKDNNTRYYFII